MIRAVGNYEFFITDAGKEIGTYDACDGTYVFCRGEISEADCKDYLERLAADGFELRESSLLGGNLYYFLTGNGVSTYVSFLRDAAELRVYAEPAGFSVAPKKSFGKAGNGTVKLFQIPADTTGTRQNGGMAYALQLSDGNFVMIDGGYYTDTEADGIYKVLRDNTPEGRKPHIYAWFMTHMHGDHYGGMIRFAEKYAADCELDGYYFSSFLVQGTSCWLGMSDKFYVLRDMWAENERPEVYSKLHTGMDFDFAGVSVKVVCTQEDVYPNSFIDANDTSTVLRIDVGEQRVLMLGDCRDNECIAMQKAFEKNGELKCDIVQYSHHGYEGATKEFYEVVDASVILFPMDIVGWQENYKTVPQDVFRIWFNRLVKPANDYLAEYMANGHIKKVIVSGAGLATISFPYVPDSEVILDYEAYYEEHKHEVPDGYELKGYAYTDESKTKIEKII